MRRPKSYLPPEDWPGIECDELVVAEDVITERYRAWCPRCDKPGALLLRINDGFTEDGITIEISSWTHKDFLLCIPLGDVEDILTGLARKFIEETCYFVKDLKRERLKDLIDRLKLKNDSWMMEGLP